MDIKQRFISQVDRKPPSPQAQVPDAAALTQIADQVTEVVSTSPLPAVDGDDARRELATKRSSLLEELMVQCGNGLAQSPVISSDTGATQATLQTAAAQDRALEVYLTGATALYEAAGDAIRIVAGESSRQAVSVLRFAHAEATRPTLPAADTDGLEGLFAKPFRLYLQDRTGSKPASIEKDRARLAELLAETAEIKLIDSFTNANDKE